jgi:hypothetical protein
VSPAGPRSPRRGRPRAAAPRAAAPREEGDESGAEVLEHVVALDLVLRYPETWAAFQGRYLHALRAALAPLLDAGWLPDGPVDWGSLRRAGRLQEAGPMAGCPMAESAAPAPGPPTAGGPFAPLYVCVAASVRLRRRA